MVDALKSQHWPHSLFHAPVVLRDYVVQIPGCPHEKIRGQDLLCGVAEGLQRAGLTKVRIVTAETLGAASFYQSVQAGEVVTLASISSVATTLGAKQVARQALEVSRTFEVIPHVVTDREALEACLLFADDHRLVVEPACGAALALVYQGVPALQGANNILLIVCGGAGVTYGKLVELTESAEGQTTKRRGS